MPALILCTLAWPAAAWAKPQRMTVFAPDSPPAHDINGLFWLTIAICLVIMILVGGAMVWFSIRYRHRQGDSTDEPPQLYGSHRIEVAWTLGPLLIVFVLFLVVFRVVAGIQGATAPKDALHVTVIGHQWWWEYKYPEYGITTANELVVPKGRPVFLTLKSEDVIHDFWVPRLSGKQDVVPGHPNRLWFVADSAGTFYGQCAEFCGSQHANMLIRVVSQNPSDFKSWVKNQQQPAASLGTLGPMAKAGAHAFTHQASCIACHVIDGVTPSVPLGDPRVFGPNLTHLMSRSIIASGMVKNTHKNLMDWVTDPQAVKPGCNMPDMGLDKKTVRDIVAYLETLK